MLKQREVEGEEWKEKGEEEQDREKENTRKVERRMTRGRIPNLLQFRSGSHGIA